MAVFKRLRLKAMVLQRSLRGTYLYTYSPSYVPKVPDVNVKTDTETYLEDGDHYMCWPVLYPQITGGDRLPGEIVVFHL